MKNELIIYTDRCLTCEETDRLYKIKQFAKDHNLEFRMKQTYVFPELKAEAAIFGAQMPFVVLGDKTVRLYSISPDPRTNELDTLL
jgi:hypothetical protein